MRRNTHKYGQVRSDSSVYSSARNPLHFLRVAPAPPHRKWNQWPWILWLWAYVACCCIRMSALPMHFGGTEMPQFQHVGTLRHEFSSPDSFWVSNISIKSFFETKMALLFQRVCDTKQEFSVSNHVFRRRWRFSLSVHVIPSKNFQYRTEVDKGNRVCSCSIIYIYNIYLSNIIYIYIIG